MTLIKIKQIYYLYTKECYQYGIRALLGQMEEITPDFAKEVSKERKRIEEGILKAKAVYLKAVAELGNDYGKIFKVDSAIENIRVELGVRSYNYKSISSFLQRR